MYIFQDSVSAYIISHQQRTTTTISPLHPKEISTRNNPYSLHTNIYKTSNIDAFKAGKVSSDGQYKDKDIKAACDPVAGFLCFSRH